ncbi:hypothetical protein [Salirhabdus salicampi]|uniref:hypothetical protein n=1 Tax=Salirhabdus salicampi TaxID=476102 RepID=UPI0020C3C3AB|nr:hypothetical protein [Salirhabdus salicampi]MCP8617949.1 hypothetical protein [Salirhabdus salicampi]
MRGKLMSVIMLAITFSLLTYVVIFTHAIYKSTTSEMTLSDYFIQMNDKTSEILNVDVDFRKLYFLDSTFVQKLQVHDFTEGETEDQTKEVYKTEENNEVSHSTPNETKDKDKHETDQHEENEHDDDVLPKSEQKAKGHDLVAQLQYKHIWFLSYTPKWDKAKLQELVKEFQNNTLGQELEELDYIKIVPYAHSGHVTGTYDVEYSQVGGQYTFKQAQIWLYNGDELTTVPSVARTLSHEYGHHFAYYWLLNKEGKTPNDKDTEWAKIRGILNNGYPLGSSHYWELGEIIAEDYVMLFGSPTGKTPKNAADFLNHQTENRVIPSPESIKGLREYWLRLTGISAAKPFAGTITVTGIESQETRVEGHPRYSLHFNHPEGNGNWEYTVIWKDQTSVNSPYQYGIAIESTKTKGTVHYGPVKTGGNSYQYPPNPTGNVFFRIYGYNHSTNQLIYSDMYWVDTSDPLNPKPINNQFTY